MNERVLSGCLGDFVGDRFGGSGRIVRTGDGSTDHEDVCTEPDGLCWCSHATLTVNLPTAAIEVMRHHLRFDMRTDALTELLFKGEKGAPLRSGSFHRAVDWVNTIEMVGLPKGFHFHDLRHFGNSLASEAGASTKELMHRLGQSTMRAALIYQHATQKRDKEIAAGIDERLAKAASEDDEDNDEDGSSGVLARVG